MKAFWINRPPSPRVYGTRQALTNCLGYVVASRFLVVIWTTILRIVFVIKRALVFDDAFPNVCYAYPFIGTAIG
jgi:hypothetical protein